MNVYNVLFGNINLDMSIIVSFYVDVLKHSAKSKEKSNDLFL